MLGGGRRYVEEHESAAEHGRAHDRHSVDDAGVLQVGIKVHHLDQVFVSRDKDDQAAIAFVGGPDPEAHLGDDAEIRLREDAVDVGPDAPLLVLPGLRSLAGAGARAHDLPVAQHNFHAADRVPAVAAVFAVGMGEAALQRMTDGAAPGGVRDIHAQGQVVFLEVVDDVVEADAGFHQHGVVAGVDVEDAIHPLQVEYDAAGQDRRGAAVTEVLAGGNGIERHQVLVGNPDDGLHLFRRIGRDGGGDFRFQVRVLVDGVNVLVESGVFVAGEDPLLADDIGEFLQCAREVLFGDSGRNGHCCFLVRVPAQACMEPTRFPARQRSEPAATTPGAPILHQPDCRPFAV